MEVILAKTRSTIHDMLYYHCMFDARFFSEAGPLSQIPPVLILFIVLWESVWKGIGLWKSAKKNHKGWFIAIFIFNTLGILPIVYIKFFQKKRS